MATVHIWTNMETAAPKRASRVERRRLRLSTLARRSGLDPRREVLIAQRNGRWVRQCDWKNTLVGKKDVVAFVVMPAGGDTLRTVASIGIMIVATIAATVIAGPAGLALSGAWYAGAVAGITAGIAIAGTYAVNALIPLPRQDGPGLSTSVGLSDAEAPTYAFSISSQQNLSRLGGAIPEWFGYHRVVPDLAATAWWEWEDGKQTLYQTLCLTKGSLDIEKIELGRTPLESFEEIDYAVFEPDDTADLFEAEVFQSPDVSSITLAAPNDLEGGDDGIYGPFAALPSGQTSERYGIDVSFPRGLYLQDGGGSLTPLTVEWKVEARKIDAAGAPIGSWFTVAEEEFDADPGATNTSSPEAGITGEFMGGGYAATNKLNSPLTVSYRYTLADEARYEFRVQRLDDKDLSAAAGHEVAWAGLRGFLGGGDYGDVTILQIGITATASVNARSVRQIAVTGTRKLSIWDAELEEWTEPQATRSIAWAVAHVLRGQNGGRLPNENFDLETLIVLDAVWEGRGDRFDYYASGKRELWEMLKTVLRAGRASPYRQGGMVRFFRDALATVPATGFSRENIVQHTIKIDYRLPEPEDDVDGFEVRYFDKRTWNFNSIRKAFVGEAEPVRPKAMPLDGVIEIAQAERELDYYVAEYRLRPISFGFDAEMEGMYPSYGDLVLVQHDSPRWGLSNRVLSWDVDELTVELFSPPVWTFSEGWYARFRDVRGRYSAQVLITAATSTTITLNNAPLYDGGGAFDFTLSDSELLHVMLGKATDAPRLARFREMVPRGGRKVSVRAVLEDDAVHVN